MAKPILDDQLWALIEPDLPPPKPRRFRFSGRKSIGNRQALTGILFVVRTGIPWQMLPKELGCGSGLGMYRWVVERTLGWLHQYWRLRIRYERRSDIPQALLDIGCLLICYKYLTGSFS